MATVGAAQEAPNQQMMGDVGDIFPGKEKILVTQEFALLECFGCEAKNRYRIADVVDGDKEGAVFLYISEESGCMERICCSKHRSLLLSVHEGNSKEGRVVQSMRKPFACGGPYCCLRPKFDVFAGGEGVSAVGHVDDPCKCCTMDQVINDAQGKEMFKTTGSICQCGMCCPFCASVDFKVMKNEAQVAEISKRPMSIGECCKKTNRFTVSFNQLRDPVEKRMLLASAMLLDLEYFEVNKNN